MESVQKRVVIIGGGVAGLTLAVALKRLNSKSFVTGVFYDVVVVEAGPAPQEDGQHLVLWRWAVEALVDDLRVGGGLSRMAAPVVGLSALDPNDLQTPINSFPPPASRLAASALASSSLPPLVTLRRCDLVRLLMLALAKETENKVKGKDYLPQPANNSGLVQPTHDDDLDADLAEGKWFEAQAFRDLLSKDEYVTGERLKLYYVHPETGKVTLEFRSGRTEVCDLLVGADGTNSSVRKLMYLNVQKQSSRSILPPVSPATPTPTTSHPRPAEFSGAAIFCGVTRLHVPPTDAPDSLEASKKPIEDLTRFDVQEFVPDGRCVTVHGTQKGAWFGCVNMGNGLLGWRLIVPQEEKGQIAANFAAWKNRELMNEAIKTNPKAGQNIMSMMGGPNSVVDQGVQKSLTKLSTDETTPEDKWNSAESAPRGRKPGKLRLADTTPDIDDNAGEGTSTDAVPDESAAADDQNDSSDADTKKARRGRRSIDMSALQSSIKSPLAVPQRMFSDNADNRPSSTNNRPSFVASSLFAAPNPLTGQEIRGLALKYAEPENFPHPIYAIMARTDPTLTTLQDTLDLASNPLDTYTLPNPLGPGFPNPPSLHRGRVILIGDAAHPVSTNANGSLAPGLAITDAVLLAKLLAKYNNPTWTPKSATSTTTDFLTPDETTYDEGFSQFMAQSVVATSASPDEDDDDDAVDPRIHRDRLAFSHLADEFDRDRVPVCTEVMKEARSDSGRFDGIVGGGAKAVMNHSVVKRLWRVGRGIVGAAATAAVNAANGNKVDDAAAGAGAGAAAAGKEELNEETETYLMLMKRGAVKKEGLPSLV